MKKFLSLALCAALLAASLAAFTSCSSGQTKSTASSASAASTENSESSERSLEVDKGLLDVTITFPASMFKDGGISDENIKDAQAEGVKVTKNSDGSVTYKMSKATHKKLMEEMKKSTSDSLSKLKTSGDYESISDVKFDNNFSTITITVDKEKYEDSMDAFAGLNAGLQGMFYQLFDGKGQNSIKVKVDFVDKNSGKVLDSVTYPDALNDSSSSQ